MKKFVVLILSLVYLTTSVGATVHLHYCMDKLVGWGLQSNEESDCDNCGMDKESSKGCCKDEQQQVKFQGEQKITTVFSGLPPFPVDIAVLPTEAYKHQLFSFVALSFPVSHAPPDKATIPVYLHNCVFRI